MRILATGGTGYAGYHACLELSAHGHDVVAITRDPDQPRARDLARMQVELRKGSAAQPDKFADLIDEADIVLHTVMDHDDPIDTDRKLFAALREAKPRRGGRRRLIYTTGCSIHGKRPELIMDENTPANPDHVLAFRMKLEEEAFALGPDLGVTVVRPGFMYGADGKSCIASQWFGMGLEGNPVYRGDREKGWSWVHVADLARAFRLIAEADRGVDGEVYCVADESRQTCLALMRRCLGAAGYEGEITFAEPDDEDMTSTWFDQNEFVTSQKIRQHLGWTPHHAGLFDEADRLLSAWQAAQENRS